MTSRPTTSRFALMEESELTADQKEMAGIAKKWAEIRHKSADEIEEPEWKEAHARFYEKYHSDMEKMQEVSVKLKKLIEPPRVQKKTKGQRKRDAYAKVVAREAVRAGKKQV